MLSRIEGALALHHKAVSAVRKKGDGRTASITVCAADKVSLVCSFTCLGAGTPQPAAHAHAGRGTCYIMVLLHPGSAAGRPAVLGWSSPSTGPSVQVSVRPRSVFIILHYGRRRP